MCVIFFSLSLFLAIKCACYLLQTVGIYKSTVACEATPRQVITLKEIYPKTAQDVIYIPIFGKIAPISSSNSDAIDRLPCYNPPVQGKENPEAHCKFATTEAHFYSVGLSEPEFYGDLVYKVNKLIGRKDFSFQFRKIITRYRRIGYNLNVICDSLHAWFLTQSWLITMLPSFIARRWVVRQTL